jgi:hypothetical protein
MIACRNEIPELGERCRYLKTRFEICVVRWRQAGLPSDRALATMMQDKMSVRFR